MARAGRASRSSQAKAKPMRRERTAEGAADRRSATPRGFTQNLKGGGSSRPTQPFRKTYSQLLGAMQQRVGVSAARLQKYMQTKRRSQGWTLIAPAESTMSAPVVSDPDAFRYPTPEESRIK